jgi:hypothetical protein
VEFSIKLRATVARYHRDEPAVPFKWEAGLDVLEKGKMSILAVSIQSRLLSKPVLTTEFH